MSELPVASILLVAKVLSGIALLVFLAALVNVWRRPRLPEFSYGTITLSQRRLRWVWVGLLVGGLGLAAAEDPVVHHTRTYMDPPAETASPSRTVRTSVSVPLPFYRYERERRMVDTRVVEETVFEGLILPKAFLFVLLAYYALVLRWNPQSPLARRILEGKRRG